MPENKLNVKVGIPQKGQIKRVQFKEPPVTLEKVIAWLNSLQYDEKVKKELIKIVSKYPCGTYYKFKKDIATHVTNIQRKK